MEVRDALVSLRSAAEQHPLWTDHLQKTGGKIVLGRGCLESPDVVFLGEAPGTEENEKGIPFCGRSGKTLDAAIENGGLPAKIAFINAVPLMPTDDSKSIRTPTKEEIAYFKPYVAKLLEALAPKYLIVLGRSAAACIDFVGENCRWGETAGVSVGFVYHPAYYLRNGTTIATDLKKLWEDRPFRSEKPDGELLALYTINAQQADELGKSEMISGPLGGLHSFTKRSGLFFRDINQVDEFIIGQKRGKLYVRPASSDNDILVPESYLDSRKDIELYMCVKHKGGYYTYVGWISREGVLGARRAQMMDGRGESMSSDMVRRVFEPQLQPMNTLVPVFQVKQKAQEIAPVKEQRHALLHMHSEFSIGDAYGRIPEICDALKAKGFKAAALTDHGTLGGVWSFQKEMLKRDLKPVLGCEVYLQAPELEKYSHGTIWVLDEKGWKNLLQLQALASREHFKRKPIIPIEELLAHSEGLVYGAGCMAGIVPMLVRQSKTELAESYAQRFKEAFPERFFFEYMLHDIEGNQQVMKDMDVIAKRLQIPWIITTDTHYPNKEDIKYHEAVKAIDYNKPYGTAGYDDKIFYMLTEEDIENLVKERAPWVTPMISEMMDTTQKIAQSASFLIKTPDEIDLLPIFMPQESELFALWTKETWPSMLRLLNAEPTPLSEEQAASRSTQFLAFLTWEGLKGKDAAMCEPERYEKQAILELNRIIRKQFVNYFLLMWDVIISARAMGVLVGPGRGSAGSCLVAYLIDVTETNPLQHGLLFDRFLSEIRSDLPDIDVDFDDRRDEVIDYVFKTYGERHCARVVTYARHHAKGVLRDIGRIFKIPFKETETLSGMVLERTGGDTRASFTLLDTFEEFETAKEFKRKYPDASDIAVRLEGHIRHRGLHAAATVVARDEIESYVPITLLKGIIVTEFDKNQVEDLHLTKLDLLGVKTLTIIKEVSKESRIPLPQNFDDPKVFELLRSGMTAGVFQFETTGLTNLTKSIKANSFKDMYMVSALFRPGALHGGQVQIYIKRAQGLEPPTPPHPALQEITAQSLGIMCYQEHIMLIMNKIGGLSWATAETVRKIVTKSKGADAIERHRQEFIKGAYQLHKMEAKEAAAIYDVAAMFGCVTGDTTIYAAVDSSPAYITRSIEHAFVKQKLGLRILSLYDDGMIRPHLIDQIVKTGKKIVWNITLEGGGSITASDEHHFLVSGTWKPLHKIVAGDYLETTEFMETMLRRKNGFYTRREKIEEIKCFGEQETYDIIMDGPPHNYIANGIVVHNSYAFPKAHAVSYSIISYWCAYLKVYAPVKFYAAILRHATDDPSLMRYLQEAEQAGISIEYPDINNSGVQYQAHDKKILAGLSSVNGIGSMAAGKIVKGRPYKSFEDFKARCKISAALLQGLKTADAFREFGMTEGLSSLESTAAIIKATKLKPRLGLQELFAKVNYPESINFMPLIDMPQHTEQVVFIRGYVTLVLNKDKLMKPQYGKHAHEFQKHLYYLNIMDSTGNITATIEPLVYELYSDIIQQLDGEVISATGLVSRNGRKIELQLLELPFIEGSPAPVRKLQDMIQIAHEHKVALVMASVPGHSKKGNSYYRLVLSDGKKGMCFGSLCKIYPGQAVRVLSWQDPFLKVQVLQEKKAEVKIDGAGDS